MKIIETNITTIDNDIKRAKLKLSEKIISKIQPLLNELNSTTFNDIRSIENDYSSTKKIITKKKIELKDKISDLKKKRKIKNLLIRVSKLIDSGLIYEGTLKSEFVILVKSIDYFDEKTIDKHLNETIKLISKRFARTI